MALLRIIDGYGKGFALELKGHKLTIGRDPSCGLQIGDTKASRLHAELVKKASVWQLKDAGSSNGTWLGEDKVGKAVPMDHGTTFRIGSTVMRFEHEPIVDDDQAKDGWGDTITGLDGSQLLELEHTKIADTDLAQANEYLILLHMVVRRSHEAGNREEVFEILDDVAADALEGDRCAVFLPAPGGWVLWPPHERRLRARFGATPFARTLLAEARVKSEPLLCTAEGDLDPSLSMMQAGMRSAMVAPLRIGENVEALLYVDRLESDKPFSRTDLEFLEAVANQLAVRLHNAAEVAHLTAEVERLSHERPVVTIEIIGQDPALEDVRSFIGKASPTDAPVLVLGESGTGKELVARSVHQHSKRVDAPMQVVNCAAIAESLVEATLFGHVKGAFTGADETRPGVFELADRGTLFLDEVGELPAQAQAKLLRALEQGEFQRIGDNAVRKVDVRIIAATNRDLQAEVSEGRFREDLYHRLDVLSVTLPPLRERPGDLDLLIDHFLKISAERLDQPVRRLETQARALLLRYGWPGNVRQLRNTIERATIMSSGGSIAVDDLPEALHEASEDAACITPVCSLSEVERFHILRVLEHCGGNKKAAAETLGIDRSTLYAKLRQYQK